VGTNSGPPLFVWAPQFGGWAPFSLAGNDLAVEISQVNTALSLVTCKCFAIWAMEMEVISEASQGFVTSAVDVCPEMVMKM